MTRRPSGPFTAGDHLVVDRGTFFHHGIVEEVRDGVTFLIHWAGNSRKEPASATIRRCTLEEFSAGDEVEIRTYGSMALGREVVVRRARRLLGWRGYNLVFANCEHFARWCKVGKWSSLQVNFGFALLGISLLAVKALRRTGSEKPSEFSVSPPRTVSQEEEITEVREGAYADPANRGLRQEDGWARLENGTVGRNRESR